jgi:DNA-binding transcriptional MerR regulator
MRPGEVSELLQIPPSSLRRYVSEFGEYLSPNAQQSKRRDYTDQDIATIARIRELTAQGLTSEDIKPQLEKTVDQDQDQETALTLPIVIQKFQDLTRQLETIQDQASQQAQQLEKLKSWAALPWWKRLFTRPPE